MNNTDLTKSVQELMAEIAAMQSKLNDLKQQANGIVPEKSVKPVVSTTRRKVLRRLAGELLAGLAVGPGLGRPRFRSLPKLNPFQTPGRV